MNELKAVDGENSGLDADLLDGKHAADFVAKTGDTMTGDLKLSAGVVEDTSGTANGQSWQSGTLYAGDKALFGTNGEGGNLLLESSNGVKYEFDAYGGDLRLVVINGDMVKVIPLASADGTWKA